MVEEKQLKLKVAEAIQDDVNKGIVRIDSSYMHEIGIRPGDIVEISGEKSTVGIADRAYPGDIGLNIIRMDGVLRRNAKTGIGEIVIVKKAQIKEAKRVTIAPAQKGVVVRASPQIFKQGLLGRAVKKGDIVSLGGTSRRRNTLSDSPFFNDIFSMLDESIAGFGFSDLKFIVAETEPKQAVIITDLTEVRFNPEAVELKEEKVLEVTYEDIGGLKDEIKKIREMVELPLKHPEIFERLGIEPPKGVLLHGSPGTGKTLLAKAVANETNSHFILINGPEIMSKFYGQSEANLRKKFEDAEKNAPAIIFIDEIDAIASKREEVHGEVERRVVAQLLAMMDGLQARGKVVVIAATNIPDSIDPALRRPGRFDREIEIGVPGKTSRLGILKIHTRNMPLDKDVDLKHIADITHGFVGADLSSLAKEAAMVVLRRLLPEMVLHEDEPIPATVLEKLKIGMNDFKEALKVVRPSAMREVLVEIPNIKWNDVGGLDDVKQELREAVEWPLKYPDAFKRLGVRPPKGILLYGPPGAGKTLLAKAVANETEANFILVKGPELLCVSADTKILTNFCGAVAIEKFYENITPISTLIESKKNYEVRKLNEPVYTYAMGEHGETKKTKIKTVHKLLVNDAYAVVMANNAELTGSANQPLLTFCNNSLEWTSLKNIQKGDYIAYPLRLSTFDKTIEVSCPSYEHLKMVQEDEENYYVKIYSTNVITKLPKQLTLDLAAFLGWFVSEGNISKEAITICNYDKENQQEIIALFEQFVDKKRITVYDDRVVAYSTPLVKYLEQLFEQPLVGKKSHTIKFPSMLAKASEDVITSFLRSAYKGDGSISMTKIEYGSMSKNLAEGITYLLTQLGIKAKYWNRQDGMSLVTISGRKDMQLFKNKVFNEKSSVEVRDEYNAQYQVPPIAPLLRKIKQQIGLHYDKEIPDGSFEHVISGRRKLGLLRLQKIMAIFDKHASDKIKDQETYKTIKRIANGDFLWTQVKEIKRSEPQIMYDVETEDHAFIGGNIPLLLHNSKWVGESERAVRKIFKKARQTSPTIIFFDEVDSLAPRRGSSADLDVTERVVNQLLTEMDGLEDLHDVVVIAATNRPDIIDTALLRPGRFDRIILASVSTPETREAIFKVHMKNMPLEDDVDIKELAQKTEGYVGADIEAICREAAMMALRDDIKIKKVPKKYFEKALEKVRPSMTKDIEEAYKDIQKFFRSARGKEMQENRPSYYG